MKDISSIVAEIAERFEDDWKRRAVTEKDLFDWVGSSAEEQIEFFDRIAIELAQGYHHKRYTYDFCDAAVNQICAIMIDQHVRDSSTPWPRIFWRVYEAFDAGEFTPPSMPQIDPVKTFTDPAIAELIREL